jgi:ribosomal protein L22
LEQLDEVIDMIRKMMIRSTEIVSKEELGRKEVVAVQQKQQQQGDGADEQIQKFVWDPGAFPKPREEAHEKELMNFVAAEYDAGASLDPLHT